MRLIRAVSSCLASCSRRRAFFALLPWFTATLLASATAGAFDADGDGLVDEADAFPCKAGAAAVAFAPAQGEFNVTMFEDQWPGESDTDFNDAVVASNFIFEMTADGKVRSLRATFNVLALGGQYNNGLGLRLLGVSSQSVSAIRQTLGAGPSTALAYQPSDPGNLTLQLLPNMRALFGNQEGPINSDPSLATQTGLPMEVEITFSTPQVLNTGDAPFDLYIFRTQAPTHEIHRPQFAGTAEMDASLFGMGNDGSTDSRHFVDRNGLPYALTLPALRPWPQEGVPIDHLYPNIVQYAASAGTQSEDFYSRGVDYDYAYGRPTPSEMTPPDSTPWTCPLALQFVGPDTIPSDTSCINAWGLSIEFGTTRDTYGYASAMDGSTIIIVGYTRAALGGLSNAGGQDIFVAKYQRDQADGVNATPVWLKLFGGSGNDVARSVAVGSNGDIYLAGETRSALLGQSNAGGSDAFLMKLSSDGTHQWTRLLGGSASDEANGVVVNSTGVYVAGGSSSFALPGASYAGATPSSFLARYDFSGNRVWTQQYAADPASIKNYSYAAALALDSSGNVYSTGSEHRYSENGSAASNAYVTKHDANGQLQWTRHLGDYGYYTSSADYRFASAFAITVSASNDIYIAGNFETGIGVMTWNGLGRSWEDKSADAFLIKLASDGTQQWATSEVSVDGKPDYALTVVADNQGYVYIGGYTAGTLPGQNYGGSFDYFSSRFSAANGMRSWWTQHDTASDDGVFGAHIDASANELYLVGNTGEITGNPVSYTNQYYGFISRHTLNAGPREAFNLTATPALVSGTSCKNIYDKGQRASGVYTIDPDGVSSGYAPFDVYCDMVTSGGGWTLVLNRHLNVKTLDATGTLVPANSGDVNDAKAINPTKWAALKAISTQAMGKFTCLSADYCSSKTPQALVASLATLALSNCKKPPTDLKTYYYAWNENSGCDGSGLDYSLWFGSNGEPHNTACYDYSSRRFFSPSGSPAYLPTMASMYVR